MKSAVKYKYKGKFNPLKLKSDNIDRLSTAIVEDNTKLLELGCSTGFMSQYFSTQKKCSVYGVDINNLALKSAQKHCQKTICGDVDDKQTWKKIKAFAPFDIVFASAIIEHLKDETKFLQNIKKILKPKGLLIITIPNVSHWRNRLNLFFGKWDYKEYGLLDKTHLRFFTYYSFQKLLKENGFKVIDLKIDPAGGIKFFNLIAKYFPNFYAHQVVYKAQKL